MKKRNFVQKGWIRLMGLGIFLLGITNLNMELKARAAEIPVISDLQVIAATDGSGVAAKCSYENYNDQSGCEIRLYLYQSGTDGMHKIAAQRLLSYAVKGMENTDFVQVPEGTYFASVVMDYHGTVKQINSLYYFKVKQVDGEYIVTQEPYEDNAAHWGKEKITESEESMRLEESKVPACNHVLEYILIRQATPDRDSVLAHQCSACGEVLDYIEVPNSAYAAFQQEAIHTIKNARTNEVIISTDRWISFHKSVFAAISERPDVAVTVRYKYQGEMYEVIIPAGADVSSLVDENGFCGFQYLNVVYNRGN